MTADFVDTIATEEYQITTWAAINLTPDGPHDDEDPVVY